MTERIQKCYECSVCQGNESIEGDARLAFYIDRQGVPERIRIDHHDWYMGASFRDCLVSQIRGLKFQRTRDGLITFTQPVRFDLEEQHGSQPNCEDCEAISPALATVITKRFEGNNSSGIGDQFSASQFEQLQEALGALANENKVVSSYQRSERAEVEEPEGVGFPRMTEQQRVRARERRRGRFQAPLEFEPPPLSFPTGRVRWAVASSSLSEVERHSVAKTWQRYSPLLRSCYERAMRKREEIFSAKIEITFNIQATGRVGAVKVGSTTLEDEYLLGCMTSWIGMWKFARPEKGPHELACAFHLSPGNTVPQK
jgi:hypothetical protein